MNKAEMIAQQLMSAEINRRTWESLGYNVSAYGIVGDGSDVTTKLQQLINLAISEGRETVFFPAGSYRVTALTNADKVAFIGDGATFTGGYTGEITSFGTYAEQLVDAKLKAVEALNKANNPVPQIPVNSISSSKLTMTSDSDKIGLIHLKQEVIEAIAGTAPVISFVADGSITPEKNSYFGIERVNLFDVSAVTQGYINSADGTITWHASAFTSDFIPIDDAKAYTTNGTWTAAYYDATKTFVSSVSGPFGTRQTPTGQGIKYLRIGFGTDQISTGMVVEGNTLPTYTPYTDYSLKIIDEKVKRVISSTASTISGIKCNLLGDSITAGGATTKSYHDYIAEEYGVIFRNYGISGSTIADYSYAGHNNPMCLRYTSMDNDADMILVFGGTNDTGLPLGFGTMADRTQDSFYGALHVLYKGLIEKYPNKRIGIITPCRRGDEKAGILQQYVDAEIEVANYYSLPALDLYRGGGLSENVPSIFATQMDVELLHPNAVGHAVLARRIANFMLSL